MGRQSSRIWLANNTDHKEMVTWNGSGFQYHDKAYIWRGASYQLVWEKLKGLAEAEILEGLTFRSIPYYASGYYIGYDPYPATDTMSLISRSKTDYEKQALVTYDSNQYRSYYRATKSGAIIFLRGPKTGSLEWCMVIDGKSGTVLMPNQHVTTSFGGYGDIADSNENNHYAFENNGNYRMIQRHNSAAYVYVLMASASQGTATQYLATMPTSSQGGVLAFVCQSGFYTFYAIDFVNGIIVELQTLGALDNYASTIIAEYPLPVQMVGNYNYTNGYIWFKSDDDYSTLYMFDIETHEISSITCTTNKPYSTYSVGWGKETITEQNSSQLDATKKYNTDTETWETITYTDSVLDRSKDAWMIGINTFFGLVTVQNGSTITNLYQGYKFKENNA